MPELVNPFEEKGCIATSSKSPMRCDTMRCDPFFLFLFDESSRNSLIMPTFDRQRFG